MWRRIAYTDSNGYGNRYCKCYTDSNRNAYSKRHAYCYCGAKVYADAPAARYASSTPISSSLVG